MWKACLITSVLIGRKTLQMYENAFTSGLVYWKRNWVYDQNVKGKKTTIISASSMVRQFKYSFLHFFFLVLEFYYYRNSECWDLKHWHSLYLKRYDSLIHYVILLHLREMHNTLQLPVFLFSFFSFFCQPYPEYRRIRSKKIFYRPSNSWSIQLFVPIKRKFVGFILFQNKSQRRGIPQRLVDKYSHLFICMLLK